MTRLALVQTGAASSIVKPEPLRQSSNRSRFVNRQTGAASSIEEIDKRRRAAGVRLIDLLARAKFSASSWWAGRATPGTTRPATLARLEAALDQLTTGAAKPAPASAIVLLYRMVIGQVASERGVAPADVLALDFSAERPCSPAWLAAARVRRLAIYLLTVELEVTNADLARAIGCSRQNIKQARDAVEEWREREGALDALIARVAALARGT